MEITPEFNSLICPHFSLFEALNIPIIFFDLHDNPRYLSPQGACLLGIKHRFNLSSCADTLDPLLNVAKELQRNKRPGSALDPMSSRGITTEIIVNSNALGNCLFAVEANDFLLSEGDLSIRGSLLSFYNISALAPFFSLLNHQKLLCQKLLEETYAKLLEDNTLPEAASESSHSTPLSIAQKSCADLLDAINWSTLEIDKLIPAEIKIVCETHTSALIDLPKVMLRNLLLSMLYEAQYFISNLGTIKLKTLVPKNPRAKLDSSTGPENFIKVVISAEKDFPKTPTNHPIQNSILQRCISEDYRLSVQSDSPVYHQLSNPNKIFHEIPAETNLNNSLEPAEGHSTITRKAINFARSFGVEVQIQKPSSTALRICLPLPLSVTKSR